MTVCRASYYCLHFRGGERLQLSPFSRTSAAAASRPNLSSPGKPARELFELIGEKL